MINFKRQRYLLLSLLMAAVILIVSIEPIRAQLTSPVGSLPGGASILPTGLVITPTAAPGSTFIRLATGLRSDTNADAAEAVTTTLSPDGKTLLVLTSGHNLGFKNETTGEDITYSILDSSTGKPTSDKTTNAEWVFVFDVSSGTPVKKQQINIPRTYVGLTWAKDSNRFYISGGLDDRVYVYKFDNSKYVPDAPFILLKHAGGLLSGTPAKDYDTSPIVSGVAVSRDGKTLVAANIENDSITIVDTATRQVTREVKLFVPGKQVATGEFPFGVAIKNAKNGAAAKAFVSSLRDDEVLAVDIVTGAIARIPVGGQPNNILLSADESLLFVANGNSDSVSVIDTNSNSVVKTISLSRPSDKYKGANPNSLALSPDERTLYVTLGGENAVAVVNLQSSQVSGRIPTGWYPNSVSVSQDGQKLYVVNAKSTAGPNPSAGRTTVTGQARNTTFRDEYIYALEKAGLSIIPVPKGNTLATLSNQVDKNNGFYNRRPDRIMRFLQNKIKYIVYVIKENRTYDQVLGDLPIGNGDPQLTVFPQAISPNHHQLALDYVTLDNFYDSGEVSGNGWGWSTFGRVTDHTEKSVAVSYGNGGFSYDYEGQNRNVILTLPQTNAAPTQLNTRLTGVLDPTGNSSILPGDVDISAPEGANDLKPGTVGGYLWDAALRAGKTVRNYGCVTDLSFYGSGQSDPTKADPNNPLYIPVSPTAYPNIPQSPGTKPSLLGNTDTYFRGYDQKQSDIYSFNEWRRDWEDYIKKQGEPPNLTMIALDHDHFGAFGNALAGLNTPELQMADNDYALGLLVETISKSPYGKETAIFVLEDDAQDGPDHVDASRSLGYVISPYTKRKTLVSNNYNTVTMIRTMEDLLNIGYLGMNDANAQPMSDVFTRNPNFTPYNAIVPGNLCKAPVDSKLVPACQNPNVVKTAAIPSQHDQQWWVQATKDFYFEVEDKLDTDAFNHVLWAGVKGDRVPYPTDRNNADLRQHRPQLLEKWGNLNASLP
ncbi:hypothetical protein F8S12_02905 [Nostoc sp. WHI]|nr:hypothetical protein [Nostoc sp. WHI]